MSAASDSLLSSAVSTLDSAERVTQPACPNEAVGDSANYGLEVESPQSPDSGSSLD